MYGKHVGLCVHDDDDFKLNQNVEYGGRKTRANEKNAIWQHTSIKG